MPRLDQHLLRAVLDNPDDDATYLVAADWFEEHGEPERAEHIRGCIKCDLELKRLRELVESKSDVPKTLTHDINEMGFWFYRLLGTPQNRNGVFQSIMHHWWAEDGLAHILSRHSASWYWWDRGFVRELEISTTDWFEHAEAILAVTPIRKIAFSPNSVCSYHFYTHHCMLKGLPIMQFDCSFKFLGSIWPNIHFSIADIGSSGSHYGID